jgi:hypothetical protein
MAQAHKSIPKPLSKKSQKKRHKQQLKNHEVLKSLENK